MRDMAVLILAAGESRRFGRCKLLAPFAGKMLLEHSLGAARALAPGNVYLVTGAWHEQLLEASTQGLNLQGVRVVHHSDWVHGMGSSIAQGVAALGEHYHSVLIMLADQPLLRLADYQQLVSALALPTESASVKPKLSADISCARYANKRGAPAIFRATCFPQLRKLQGDRGAKSVLYSTDFKVVEVALDRAELDIDTPQALAKAEEVVAQ